MGLMSLAQQGRNGDTMVAHMTPGEMVVPREVAAMRPELVAHIQNTLAAYGVDPSRYVVGTNAAYRNPQTGAQEFATAEEIQSAYQTQLGRDADDAGLQYWLANPDSFSNGGFSQGVAAEKAANANSDPTYSDWGGQQVRTDGAFRNQLVDGVAGYNKASGENLTAKDYDATINPDTYGARWGGAAVTKTKTTPGMVDSFTPDTNRQVTADQTIEGRVNGLLGQDANGNYTNQVVRQAVERAQQQFAGRGLLNSSMAAQAGQEAAIAKAIEIAGPDAQTYFQQSRANQDARNTFAQGAIQQTYTQANAAQQQGYTQANTAAQYAQDDKTLASQQSFNLQANYITALDNATNRYNTTVANIQNNPNLTPEARTEAIAQAASVRDGELVYANTIFSAMPTWKSSWASIAVPTASLDISADTNQDRLFNIINDPAQPEAVKEKARARLQELAKNPPAAPAPDPAPTGLISQAESGG